MNYMVLNGSPLKDKSVSMMVANTFIEGIRSVSPDDNIDIFNLAELDIKPCRGCYACWSHVSEGECIMTKRGIDDMKMLMEKYDNAGRFIIVTPMHFFNISSNLQKFFERTFSRIKAEYVPVNGRDAVYNNVFTDMSTRDIAVISTCKVAFEGVWKCIEAQMHFLSKGRYQKIFSTQPFVLKTEDKVFVDEFMKNVFEAGREFAQDGKFSDATNEKLISSAEKMAQNINTIAIGR